MEPKSIHQIINNSALNFQERKKVAQKKERFIMTAQLKELFNTEAKKYYLLENRNFTVNEDNKSFLNIFCKYFAQDPDFETSHKGELRKGLFVFGPQGTGKTSSFKIMQNVSRTYHLNQVWVPIIYTQKVVEQFNLAESGKTDYVIQYFSKGKFMFDDVGAEKEASNFGKEDIFGRIMELRYNQAIRSYSRKCMMNYAKNFNKNITYKDVSWFAKVEHQRRYKGYEDEVIKGKEKSGAIKPGLQTHVHITVSRMHKYKRVNLSPRINARKSNKLMLNGINHSGGFDRSNWKQLNEDSFDKMFGYSRSLEEKFETHRILKNGRIEEQIAMKSLIEKENQRDNINQISY